MRIEMATVNTVGSIRQCVVVFVNGIGILFIILFILLSGKGLSFYF